MARSGVHEKFCNEDWIDMSCLRPARIDALRFRMGAWWRWWRAWWRWTLRRGWALRRKSRRWRRPLGGGISWRWRSLGRSSRLGVCSLWPRFGIRLGLWSRLLWGLWLGLGRTFLLRLWLPCGSRYAFRATRLHPAPGYGATRATTQLLVLLPKSGGLLSVRQRVRRRLAAGSASAVRPTIGLSSCAKYTGYPLCWHYVPWRGA